MKRISNWTSLMLTGGLMLTAAAPQANADAWNKKTYVTISRSIEVPGAILEPGKYVFKLVESQSNRHIVQIMNADENRVLATNLTIAKQRETPADKTILTFYEMPGGGPEPVRAWFYPGDTIGHEFLYSRNRAKQIAQAGRADVPVVAQAMTGASQNQSVAVNSEPAPSTVAQSSEATEAEAVAPAPYVEPEREAEVAPVAEPAPMVEPDDQAAQPVAPSAEPQATPAPTEPAMPHTASNLFAAGILGLSCLGIAGVARTKMQRKEE